MSQPAQPNQPRQGAIPGASLSDAELDAYHRKQAEEWGVWIADPDGPGIYHNGALAYQPGAPVPVSNVEKYAYDKQGLVKRVNADPPAEPKPKASK